MLRVFLILAAGFLSTRPAVYGQNPKVSTDPYAELQGIWQVESVLGKAASPDDDEEIRVTGRNIEIGYELDALFSVDATKNPKHMDLRANFGDTATMDVMC